MQMSFQSYVASVTVAAICAFIASCSVDNTQPVNPIQPNQSYHGIIGTWEWVRSYDPSADYNDTPERKGYTKGYIFESSGEFQFLKKNALAGRGRYVITRRVTTLFPDTMDILNMLDISGQDTVHTQQVIVYIPPGTLHLLEDCPMCWKHTYVRR